MRALNWCLIGLIRLYQATVSKLLGRCGVKCLHYPSCSEYAVGALRKYHLRKAFRLTYHRLRDCKGQSDRPYLDFP